MSIITNPGSGQLFYLVQTQFELLRPIERSTLVVYDSSGRHEKTYWTDIEAKKFGALTYLDSNAKLSLVGNTLCEVINGLYQSQGYSPDHLFAFGKFSGKVEFSGNFKNEPYQIVAKPLTSRQYNEATSLMKSKALSNYENSVHLPGSK